MKIVMKKKSILTVFLFILAMLAFPPAGTSRDTVAKADSVAKDSLRSTPEGMKVKLFNEPVFRVFTKIGPFSVKERASAIQTKIEDLARDPLFVADSLKIVECEGTWDLVYEDEIITTVTPADARAEKSAIELIAKERRMRILLAISGYQHTVKISSLLRDVGLTLGVLILLIIIIRLNNRLFRFIITKIESRKDRMAKALKIKDYNLLDEKRQMAIVIFLIRAVKTVILLAILLAGLTTIFYILPWTKRFTVEVLKLIIIPLGKFARGIVQFIPNLLIILLILIFSRLIIKLLKFLRNEIEKGAMKLPGFHADFALPTYNILRILVVAFTLIFVWPFLPGSDSHIFQGVSVFLGLLFSLTSASTLSNVIAGFSLTYTRAFRIGDRVKIGEMIGIVTGKTMLVTKLRTFKNEEITIPNSKIISNEVVNYSASAEDEGVILHTTITIGYDAPWRKIHELLISAANATDGLLKEPKPFVLQTSLDDFYVSYEINAYTRSPELMPELYAHLHENIQDNFNEAGMEIMSPHYRALRDGNTMAVPEEYRGKDYETPAIRIEKK